MSHSETEVDYDAIARCAQVQTTLAEGARKVMTRLNAAIPPAGSFGSMPDSDELAATLHDRADKAGSALEALAGSYEAVRDNLGATVAAYKQQDDTAATVFGGRK